MIMGLGDGMAAIVGTKWGKHKYRLSKSGSKSLEGTLAMMIASFLVVYYLTPGGFLVSFVVALAASALENISPSGVDNATVPIISSILLEALCRL